MVLQSIRGYAAIVLQIALAQLAFAQLPAARLLEVSPAGGNAGKSFDVAVHGADLDDATQLSFSHPGITATPKMAEPGPFDKGPVVVPGSFVVTVAGNVPVGVYEARVFGKYGLSNPRAFTISDTPESLEVEPNNSLDQATEIVLPLVVNGRCQSQTDVDYFKFKPTAAQRLILRCEARQIDSQNDAVVVVYDAAGRVLANSRDDHARDPLVDLNVAANVEYIVKVYDTGFRGGDGFGYRLTIGAVPHIDFLFPPAAEAGGTRQVTVFGRNLPGGQPAGINLGGRPLEKLAVNVAMPTGDALVGLAVDPIVDTSASGIDATHVRVKGPAGSSNAVLLGVAAATPVLETETNNTPETAQKLTLPCEVQGQFNASRDQDWFQFEAKAGEEFALEVISQRLGLPTNPTLLLQQIVPPTTTDQPSQVNQMALIGMTGETEAGPEFNARCEDPVLRFTAPADGTYRVLLRDGRNALQTDPRQNYRLMVRRPQPDFRLVAVAEGTGASLLLRKGEQASIRVLAHRRDGFNGDIKITAQGLPAGVTCKDGYIGAQRNSAVLVLSADANAAPANAMVQIVGVSQLGNQNLQRTARLGTSLFPYVQPQQNQPGINEARVARNLAISVSSEPGPVTLTAGNGQIYETSRGGVFKVPYTRNGPFGGQLNVMARDIPRGMTGIQLQAGNTGELEVRLSGDAAVGTYSFYLWGMAQGVKYRRNPEAAAAATARKAEVDKIAADEAALAKVAADEKAAADKANGDAVTAVQTAMQAKQQADRVLEEATSAAKTSAQALVQAKAAAAANPNDANAAAAAVNAQKAADDAALKAKTSGEAVIAAQKALDDAMKAAKIAADAKTVADEKASAAAERAKLAMELKTRTDQLVQQTTESARERDFNTFLVSNPITLRILPAPITVATSQPLFAVKQGGKVEVSVTITRLLGYTGAVNFSTILPQNTNGFSVPNANIPEGQTQTKFEIPTTGDAPLAEHTLTLRAQMNVNGQNVVVDTPYKLKIESATP
jgi:hypothetical protein